MEGQFPCMKDANHSHDFNLITHFSMISTNSIEGYIQLNER